MRAEMHHVHAFDRPRLQMLGLVDMMVLQAMHLIR